MSVSETSGATASIARFVAEADMAGLPELAIENAKRAIVDSFACILSGAGSELGAATLAYVALMNATGTAPVLGTSVSTTPSLAAMANGTFSAALDYDDLLSPLHPSAPIVAALASVAESGATGREFIDAYILGVEVCTKIAKAIGRGHSGRGYHATGTLTGFGAVAAIARLRRVPPEVTAQAMGFMASMAGGLLCSLGNMSKPVHSGLAAQNAVNALAMVESGLTANPGALEHKYGFFAAFGDEQSDASAIAASLGRPWTVIEPGSTLKKYPSCVAGHRAMDAIQELKRQGLTADNAVAIDCSVAPGALNPLMHPNPMTGFESKFSMQYALAAALADDVRIATFETPALARPEIRTLLPKITAWEDSKQVEEDPVQANLSWGYRGYARVTARLADGRTLTARVDVPPGHPSRPLSWDEMRTKFLDCADSVGTKPDRAAAIFDQMKTLDTARDIQSAINSLRIGA